MKRHEKYKESMKESRKKWLSIPENREKIRIAQKKWRAQRTESQKQKAKETYAKWLAANPNYHRDWDRKVYGYKPKGEAWTKEKRKEYIKEYARKKRQDPIFKMSQSIRSRLSVWLKGKRLMKSKRTEEILGCSFYEFKQYIESKFEPWMTWENYGKYNGEKNHGWHLDHIIPICSAITIDDIMRLNHYTNLQPLCSYLNMYVKRGKIPKIQ